MADGRVFSGGVKLTCVELMKVCCMILSLYYNISLPWCILLGCYMLGWRELFCFCFVFHKQAKWCSCAVFRCIVSNVHIWRRESSLLTSLGTIYFVNKLGESLSLSRIKSKFTMSRLCVRHVLAVVKFIYSVGLRPPCYVCRTRLSELIQFLAN